MATSSTTVFEDLSTEPEPELEVEEKTYSVRSEIDKKAIQDKAQAIFNEPYVEGSPRTFGQLWPQRWVISVAKQRLINEGLLTRERSGWSPEDEENFKEAGEKYKAFVDLTQDRERYEAIQEGLEGDITSFTGLARGVRAGKDITPPYARRMFGTQLTEEQVTGEEEEERALELEAIPLRRAGRQKRRAAASLAGLDPNMPELPRGYFPLVGEGLRGLSQKIENVLGATYDPQTGTYKDIPSPEEAAAKLKEDLPFLGFAFLQMFGPRNPSARQAKDILIKGGIPVTNVWQIDHTYPEAGLVVQLEDGNRYFYDSPDLDMGDVVEFLGTEFAPLLLDIVLTGKAGKAMSAFRKGTFPNAATNVVKNLGLAATSAVATGGGEYLRLMVGSMLGAHDMSEAEMTDSILKEMALAGAGSTAMLSAFNGISWARRLFQPEPAEGWFKDMAPAIARWEHLNERPFPFINDKVKKLFPEYSEERTKVAAFFDDHPQSLKEVEELLEKLGVERIPGSKDIYRSSLGRQTGAEGALAAEGDLMLFAEQNPMVAAVFKAQILHGHRVAMTLLNRMHKGKFPTDVNAADLAQQIADELGIKAAAEALPFQELARTAAREPLDRFEREIGEVYRDADITVPGLWKEGDVPEQFFEPRPTGGGALVEEIKVDPREALEAALKNPEYQGGVELSPATRKLFKQWFNMGTPGKGTRDFFIDPRITEAVEEIYKLIPTSTTTKGDVYSILAQLAGYKKAPKLNSGGHPVKIQEGRNKGKIQMVEIPPLGPLTLDQLNTMRLVLNYMVGTADVAANPTLRPLLQNTKKQLGVEITRLQRQLASQRSGKAPTSGANKQWIKDNGFMDDVRLGWIAQNDAIKVSRYAFTQAIKDQDPSRFMHNLLGMYRNTGKSKLPDRELSEIIENLERIGRHEDVRDIRGVVVDYIRQTLADENTSILEQNNAYRQFLEEYTPFLKALFPPEDFGRLNTLPAFLRGAVDAVDDNALKIAEIEKLYKNKPIQNIVKDFLNKEPDISAGDWVADIGEYLDLIKDNPALQEETKQVAWNWMLYDAKHGILVGDKFGGQRVIDPRRLENLLAGFRTGGGPTHQLEAYFGKLLGKEGPEYIKALRTLNRIVQEQSTIPPSLRPPGKQTQEPQTKFFERIFIAPLTQFGRRFTALRGAMGKRAQVAATNALHDPELLGRLMRTQGRRLTMKQYISALAAWNVTHNYDLAAEDEEEPLDPEQGGLATDFLKKIPGTSLSALQYFLETGSLLAPEAFVTEPLPNLPKRTGTDG